MSVSSIYEGIILVQASPGYVREARGLVGRAIDAVLGKQPRRTAPHGVSYRSDADREGAGAAYTLTAAGWQFAAICDVAKRMSIEEGWSDPPFEAYWDHTVPRSSFTDEQLLRFRKR
jgi:hypothetical protein